MRSGSRDRKGPRVLDVTTQAPGTVGETIRLGTRPPSCPPLLPRVTPTHPRYPRRKDSPLDPPSYPAPPPLPDHPGPRRGLSTWTTSNVGLTGQGWGLSGVSGRLDVPRLRSTVAAGEGPPPPDTDAAADGQGPPPAGATDDLPCHVVSSGRGRPAVPSAPIQRASPGVVEVLSSDGRATPQEWTSGPDRGHPISPGATGPLWVEPVSARAQGTSTG